jgi:hypothetical protein
MARHSDQLSVPRGLRAAALLSLLATACESVLGFERGVLETGDGVCATSDAGACSAQAGAAPSTAGAAGSDPVAGGTASAGAPAGVNEPGSAGAAGSSSSGANGTCRTSEDCPNADPDCGVRCELRGAVLTCVPFPLDADHDLFASAACQAAPGDDCDDSQKDVNPLADERCDGIDGDCDGLADIQEDHLPLSGNTVTLADVVDAADVAWSEAAQVFGLAWVAGQDHLPYFAPLTVSGVIPIEPVALDVLPLGSAPTLAIAAGDQTFAVAWNDVNLYYRTVDGSGALGLPVTLLSDVESGFGSDSPALTWTEAGAWAAVWNDLRDNRVALYGRTLFPNGEQGPESLIAEMGFYPSVAALGQRVAAAWSAAEGRARLFTQDLDPVGALPLDGAVSPVVGSNGVVFGLAWRVDKLRFIAFDADGEKVCEGATEADDFVPLDIVATEGGFLLFGGSPNVQAIEVSSGCDFGARVSIDSQRASFVRAASAGTRGTTVVWGAAGATNVRHFGAHFCD